MRLTTAISTACALNWRSVPCPNPFVCMSITSTEVEVRTGYDIAEDGIKEIMANDSSREIS